MRKQLFFLAFILLGIVLNAQTTWIQQATNMSGTSIGVDQVSAIDSNIVWINGFNGSGTSQRARVCSRTQNGGTTWVAGTYSGFGATVFPQVLCGVTYNKAFAVAMDTATGGYASFWKTINGGTNWSLVSGIINNGSTTFADGVMFWDTLKGFCYGDPVSGKFDIYYTIDGGTTWTPTLAANIAVPLSGEFGYNGFDCAAKMEGGYAAFVTNMGRVYKTSNYGVNWTATITAPFTAIGNGKIYIVSANKMIVAGMVTPATTFTWKQTVDGGATWITYSPSANFYNYAMTYVPYSGSMLVSTSPASGASGVSYSTDAGASWTNFTDPLLQTAGVNNQCLGVGFADASHGWVGNYTTLTNSILKVVIALPGSAGNITGSTNICQGQNAVIYTVPAIANATSYIWTLPNGATGTSTTNSISVNYAAATYGNITVKGHNTYGNGTTASLTITVNPLPVITFITNPLYPIGCAPLSVTFSNNTTPVGSTYLWSFGDGQTSTLESPTHIFTIGDFTIGLTATTPAGCSKSWLSNSGFILSAPIPNTPVITRNGDTLISNSANGNQWYNLVTGIINFQTAQKYLPPQSGDYFVIVTMNECSSDSSAIFHFTFTGIGENSASDFFFSILPNPARDVVYLKAKGLKGKVLIEIYDIQGKVIYSEISTTREAVFIKEINANKFEKGIYFLKISNEQIIRTGKIVFN